MMSEPSPTTAPTGIPDGITHNDVLEAVAALDRANVEHRFGASLYYDLLQDSKRYLPNAVFGFAARRLRSCVLDPKELSAVVTIPSASRFSDDNR
jgi:hypothetical protein